jgi:putative ABC transport system ATP-binding protein
MINLKNITVTRNGRMVLKNVSANIEKGDIITIVGPNGAGKSTFFELIAGCLKPAEGAIIIDGQDVTHLSDRQRASFISRLCQNPNFNVINEMNISENLMLANLRCRKARLSLVRKMMYAPSVDNLLRSVFGREIEDLLDIPVESLSGGQKQTIAFAMAIVKQPKILLLDEPTAALDPTSAAALLGAALKFIKSYAITTLLITHDISIAKHIGNKLWVLSDGSISSEINNEEHNLSNDMIMHIMKGV